MKEIMILAKQFLESDLSLTAFAKSVEIAPSTIRRRFMKIAEYDKELHLFIQEKISSFSCHKKENSDKVLKIANLIIETGLPLMQIKSVLYYQGIEMSYSALKDLVHIQLPKYDLSKYCQVKEILTRSSGIVIETSIELLYELVKAILVDDMNLNEIVDMYKKQIDSKVIYENIFNKLKKIDPKLHEMVINHLINKCPIINLTDIDKTTEMITEMFVSDPTNTSTRKTGKKLGYSHITIYNHLKKMSLADNQNGEIITGILNGNKPATVKDDFVLERILKAVKLLRQGFTVIEIANIFEVSSNVIYNDLSKRTKIISQELYEEVKSILETHKLANLIK